MCSPCPASSGSFKKPCQSLLRAHAPLARDEFILHSPTSRGEFDAWARIRAPIYRYLAPFRYGLSAGSGPAPVMYRPDPNPIRFESRQGIIPHARERESATYTVTVDGPDIPLTALANAFDAGWTLVRFSNSSTITWAFAFSS